MTRFLLWQIFGAALLLYAFASGALLPVVAADETHLTLVIGAILVTGVLICGHKLATLPRYVAPDTSESQVAAHIAIVRTIANSLLALGLVGTVYGFIIVARAITPEAAGNADAAGALVAALLAGLGTALPTTLAGVIGRTWLMFCGHMLRAAATEELAKCTR